LSSSPHLPRWFLKFAFRLLYNQLAWTYDLVAWLVSFGQWGTWRRTATLFFQEGPILELGHGTGGFMVDMAERDLAPVGLDLSPYMARRARKRLLREGTVPCLVSGQAQRLPFPDAAFANVVATFPTDYILEPQTLISIARVLRPGGLLVIVTMGYLTGTGLWRGSGWRLAGRFIDWLYRITGQHEIPEPKPLTRLHEYGFSARWEDATLEGAKARLLVATRR
jgi:ubiquinone/menaquinone biosynthesis C-methylase UbiE